MAARTFSSAAESGRDMSRLGGAGYGKRSAAERRGNGAAMDACRPTGTGPRPQPPGNLAVARQPLEDVAGRDSHISTAPHGLAKPETRGQISRGTNGDNSDDGRHAIRAAFHAISPLLLTSDVTSPQLAPGRVKCCRQVGSMVVGRVADGDRHLN